MNQLWPDREIKVLGVMSDTHGDLLRTRQASCVFQEMQIDVLLHCGDIGSPDVPAMLASVPGALCVRKYRFSQGFPAHAITQSGGTCHERVGDLLLAGRRVIFMHGDQIGTLRAKISDGQYDLVCFGHTHEFAEYYRGKTLVLNPGALHRTRMPSVAVVDLTEMTVTRIPIP